MNTTARVLLLLSLATFATAGESPDASVSAPTRFIVYVPDPIPVSLVAATINAEVRDEIGHTGLFRFEVPAGGDTSQLDYLLELLRENPMTLFAEYDRPAVLPEISGCTVGGSQVQGQQCTIAFADGSPSEAEFLRQSALANIDAEQAQGFSRTDASVVAVIDTGIDFTHPLFEGKILSAGYDFLEDLPFAADVTNGIDDDFDALVDESYGHGTHIAGTVLAVNPNAKILPMRVLDADGIGWAYDVADAIFQAVDAGVNVINLSLTINNSPVIIDVALAYAEANGVIVVAAAGNTGAEAVLSPASYEPGPIIDIMPFIPKAMYPINGRKVLAVAAVDVNDRKADFSAWGEAIDLSAPGVDIYSAMPRDAYAWWSGTSMATGVVSGGASLLFTVAGPTNPDLIASTLIGTTDDIDALNPDYAGKLGSGRLDLLNAVMTMKAREGDTQALTLLR